MVLADLADRDVAAAGPRLVLERRSSREPGSVHTACTFQLVFTMQNAVPHDAAASAARPSANAANSSLLILLS
jgi:hypothetical protein